MKTLIKILFVVIIGYLLWTAFSNKKEVDSSNTSSEQNESQTMLLKGEVTGNFSFFNQTVIAVKKLNTNESYHVLLTTSTAPSIGSPVIIKIKKYDIVKINDKSITLYKEVG
jgi:hypothetical protein